jgi:hypothetical protein
MLFNPVLYRHGFLNLQNPLENSAPDISNDFILRGASCSGHAARVGHRLRLRAFQKTLSLSRTLTGPYKGESLTFSFFRAARAAGIGAIFYVPGIVIAGSIGVFL